MKKILYLTAVGTLCAASMSYGLTLISPAFDNGDTIPYKYGYCVPDGKGKVKLGQDISPELHWANVPKGTKSFVLLMRDHDIPSQPLYDISGKEIPKGADRDVGYLWVLVDIPGNMRGLPQGAGSKGFDSTGKNPGKTKYGLSGLNIYTTIFQAPLTKGGHDKIPGKAGYHHLFGQYDGPCPPWNDAKKHKYSLQLYALDVAKLDLNSNGHFQGSDVIDAMKGHILAKSDELSGDYVTNAKLLPKKQVVMKPVKKVVKNKAKKKR